jgi:hypothetical protein
MLGGLIDASSILPFGIDCSDAVADGSLFGEDRQGTWVGEVYAPKRALQGGCVAG